VEVGHQADDGRYGADARAQLLALLRAEPGGRLAEELELLVGLAAYLEQRGHEVRLGVLVRHVQARDHAARRGELDLVPRRLAPVAQCKLAHMLAFTRPKKRMPNTIYANTALMSSTSIALCVTARVTTLGTALFVRSGGLSPCQQQQAAIAKPKSRLLI